MALAHGPRPQMGGPRLEMGACTPWNVLHGVRGRRRSQRMVPVMRAV